MYDDLKKVIVSIKDFYDRINAKWKNLLIENTQETYNINLKKKLVVDIMERQDIYNFIQQYRSFIMVHTEEVFEWMITYSSEHMHITSRVKQQNSVQYKIQNYIKNHENGKVPIIKCFNDLFGVRIILHNDYKLEEVVEYINKIAPELKCIDSSKNDYKAIHVYFKDGNSSFPWELQIWCQCDEKNNLESHKKYKQDYTSWERDNCKGGG